MSATCRFCGQEWANAQAVRAHLKGCAAYQARPSKASPSAEIPKDGGQSGRSIGNESPGNRLAGSEEHTGTPFDPVHQLRQRLATERTRLELREVEDVHAEFDRRAEAKERGRQQQMEQKAIAERMAERDRENAQRLAEDKRKERERREAVENQRQKRRREIIQSVKHQVVEQWFPPILGRPDLKAQVLKDIERELAALPVEDLPRAELVLIAEGIRDRLYRGAVDAMRRSQEQATRRQRHIQHGCDYAGRELRETEGLSLTEIWKIESRVRDDLAAVEGDETTADIEDWVDEILEDEGIGFEDDDE